jgi:hypothetical protein
MDKLTFSPGENFHPFYLLDSLVYSANFLSYVSDYIEDMAIFAALMKV